MAITTKSPAALVTLPAIARRAGVANMTAWRRFRASGILPDAILMANGEGADVPCFNLLREAEIRATICKRKTHVSQTS